MFREKGSSRRHPRDLKYAIEIYKTLKKKHSKEFVDKMCEIYLEES